MKKRAAGVLVALAAIAAAVLVLTGGASALAGSDFEGADGNLIVNTPGNHDWVNAPNLSAGQDLPTGTGDNSFGQGTKEDLTNVTVVSGSIPNSKADLARFAVAGESVGTDNFIYLAWSRENQSGTVNFDFEINRAAQPDLTTPGAKTLVRTQGDLLINYAFAGGSNTPTLTVLDRARAPEIRIRPRRTMMVMVATATAALLCAAWVLLKGRGLARA